MKKCITLVMAFFFVVSSACVCADSIQDKSFKELDKKLEKYDTVDFKNIEGIPTYILNLKGTDLDVIEAYLETHKDKDEVVLYERTDDGKWVKQVLKRIKSRHA
ncbi:MAG TPA: hypothetical protein ACFYD6_06640 [Candidatus Brocadiia bacterium]|nr:hypothetical protein [Candidatus Brocadiales bacterium]